MTTDNRTNEPPPEQVEAAATSLANATPDRSASDWQNLHEFEREKFRTTARAALVAAQGSAPQAERTCDCGLNGEADCYSPEGTPVQPSSTVDEDALAEVISETDSMVRIWHDESDLLRESAKIARAVAEWLKGAQQ